VGSVGTAEYFLLMFKTMQQKGVDFTALQMEANNSAQKKHKTPATVHGPATQQTGTVVVVEKKFMPRDNVSRQSPPSPLPREQMQTPNNPESTAPADMPLAEAESDASKNSAALDIAHGIVYGVKTVLPKTTDTIDLLQRSLVKAAKLPEQPGGPETQRMHAAQIEFIDILRGRSIAWIVGTSLGFEAFILFWAALIFCRRDY
jgi:hypothetical protein